jgi:hypothetical protein
MSVNGSQSLLESPVNHWKYLVNCPRARTEPRIEIKLKIERNTTEFPSSKLHYFNRLWCRLTHNGRTVNDESINQSGDKDHGR